MKNTRARLTWFGVIAITGLTMLAIAVKMESVALLGIPSIAGIIAGYQTSQGYTKGQFIKANPNDKNLEP